MSGWIARIVVLHLLAVIGVARVGAADYAPKLLAADHSLLSAFNRHDSATAAKLLDADFTWTNGGGVMLTRAQVLEKLPAPDVTDVPADRNSVIHATHLYGDIGIVEVQRGRIYIPHVWVKRPAGWRALVCHGVQILDAPLPAGATASTERENPCKWVPFEAKNATERGVITSYQDVERAVTAHDDAAWGDHIADEFFAVRSNGDRSLDKAMRTAGLANQKQGGIAPFPLV